MIWLGVAAVVVSIAFAIWAVFIVGPQIDALRRQADAQQTDEEKGHDDGEDTAQ